MYVWFTVCLLGLFAIVPLHFMSVEHRTLQKQHGKERGIRVGEALGLISGWGLFLFWIGLWVSPQPRFSIPLLQTSMIEVPFLGLSCTLLHLAVSIPLLLLGSWFGIGGVRDTSLRVAETHRPDKIVTEGVYSVVRHPQYLGGLLAHVAMSFLLSARFSLIATPVVIGIVFVISKKEEAELIREFGEKYQDYQEKVPMLIPRLRRAAIER
ncbi:MAG: isoprenylcysteine carboxylmethyltransferase family protein [Candidatus Bathyarchaeota archaeon]|nr:isoprenylcysteine carboxylmethyltransferase family protein [Candidatus Bathyarchaeota archaeon]